MQYLRPLAASLAMCFQAPTVLAAAQSYEVTFTSSIGSYQPSPSRFAFDPVTGFSQFILNIGGAGYDITSSANSPSFISANGSSTPGTFQDGFEFFSQGYGTANVYLWTVTPIPLAGSVSIQFFTYLANSQSPRDFWATAYYGPMVQPLAQGASGFFSTSAVPEASQMTMYLLGAVLGLAMFALRPHTASKVGSAHA